MILKNIANLCNYQQTEKNSMTVKEIFMFKKTVCYSQLLIRRFLKLD